jgi:hypothetical protein
VNLNHTPMGNVRRQTRKLGPIVKHLPGHCELFGKRTNLYTGGACEITVHYKHNTTKTTVADIHGTYAIPSAIPQHFPPASICSQSPRTGCSL